MTIIALRMALDAVDATFATARCIALASRTPTVSACHPTDFRFTHRTLEPIAAPFFHDDDLEMDDI